MSKLVAAFVLIMLTAGVARSADVSGLVTNDPTGNDFMSTCRDSDTNGYDFGLCIGFVHGVLNSELVGALRNLHSVKGVPKHAEGLPCIPDGVTNDQLIKVVLHFADNNPEGLQRPAAALVTHALITAWGEYSPAHPCS